MFQVQFIVGKQILPWFGGVPAVWTTCMLFFQVLLLVGYGYAHLVGSSRSPGRQRAIHLAVLALAVALLVARMDDWASPITASDAWKPGPGDHPIVAILRLLFFAVGLPYLVLATTGPLMQNWFGRCFPGRSPYRLYALSNLGSLLGLLSYPFLLEPKLGLAGQGWVWFFGFILFALGCGGCAVLVGRTAPLPATTSTSDGPAAPPPTAGRRVLWFGLAMVASVALLATTSQISLEVAVVPFLWMVPLSLYLMTFILCFEYERSYRRRLWTTTLLLGTGASAAVISLGETAPTLVQLAVYLVTLFAACMVCHGEVVRHKPDPSHLTGFYLFVAGGGAAGGVFAGIVAPALFPDLWEFPLALIAACAFGVFMTFPPTAPVAGGATADEGRPRRLHRSNVAVLVAVIAVALAYGGHAFASLHEYVHVGRGFFGVLRVGEEISRSGKLNRQLTHGRIIHGYQFADPELARTPTSYYSPNSGVGLAIRNHPRRVAGQPMKFGFVGLGTGTLATYPRRGDSVRFYEINPDVIDLSSGPAPTFTYVRDCAARVEIAVGDARINLEREPPQAFDLLALDAFSSDSIPAHLLTAEAGRLYARHLAADGILAIHISNRHLDLDPVVRGLADLLGFAVVRVDVDENTDTVSRSSWMVLARDRNLLAAPDIQGAAGRSRKSKRAPLVWTDSYSNLLQVFVR